MSFSKATKARGVEALIGGVLGYGGGKVVGKSTYEPKAPKEWVDEYGNFQVRSLDPLEEVERLQHSKNLATKAGFLSAAAALGLSKMRRGRISNAEIRKAKKTARKYIGPLESIVKKLEKSQAGPHAGNEVVTHRLNTAREMLKNETSRLKAMVYVAEKKRSEEAFGGLLKEYGKDPMGRMISVPKLETTHEGQIIKSLGGHEEARKAFLQGERRYNQMLDEMTKNRNP